MFDLEPVPYPNIGVLYKFNDPVQSRLKHMLAFITQQEEGTKCYFPGPNPVSIDRGNFPELTQQPYVISEKTDGIRFVLMFCMYQDVKLCVLFDRTLTPYLFKIKNCPRVLFQGTVFDGELAYDTHSNSQVFLIFDAVAACGIPVFRSPFSTRMMITASSLTHYTYTDGYDTAKLEVKKFWSSKREFLSNNSSRFKTDGVILMPELDPVVSGKHTHLFKLKTHHTLDFLVRNKKLYVFDEKTRRNKVVGVPTGPKASLAKDGCIVECERDPNAPPGVYDRWVVLLVRNDKKTSNTKWVYEKTLLNIKESLTLDQLPLP